MKCRNVLFTILLLTASLLQAQTITHYEYWFGNDANSRKTVAGSSGSVNITIPTDGMSQGLQTLNFRVRNSNGDWSPVQRMLFFIPVAPEASATVTGWEWWFDGDTQNRKSGSGNQTSIAIAENIGSLTTGLHYLNFRVRNSNGDWSPISRFLLIKPVEAESAATLTDAEYWIDDDYAHCVREKSSTTAYTFNKDISSLPIGVHIANIRVRNSAGDWSPVSRYLFYVSAESETSPSPYVGYYYSFNSNTTYVSIAESTNFILQDKVLTIPDLQQIGDLNNGCTFTVDPTNDIVSLSRTQAVNFSLRCMKKDGSSDISIQKSFDLTDALSRNATNASIGKTWNVSLTGYGDYRVLAFDNLLKQDITFSSSSACRLRIFNQQGNMLSNIALTSQQKLNLPSGRYYAVISHPTGTTQNSNITYSVGLSAANSSSGNSNDDLQDYLDSFVDQPDILTQTTYTRQFLNTDWQSLYVPFSLSYSDWSTDFEIAQLKGLNSYDDNSDGTVDRQELVATVMTATDGDLQANHPYLIRAKQKGTYTLYPGAARMVAQNANSTVYTNLRVTGSYTDLKGMKSARQYRLAGGSLWIPNSDDDVLRPFRWYATILIAHTSSPVIMRIISGTTSVTYPVTIYGDDEQVGRRQVYDLSGRRVHISENTRLSSLPKDVYLIDGRKVIVK